MPSFFSRVLHPDWYHGHRKRPPFFEGWYFKLVSADAAHRIAVIPGIFKSDDPAKAHAFVQVLDGVSGEAFYHRFPTEAFEAAEDRFEVQIADNRFTAWGFDLNLDDGDHTLRGEVTFPELTPWPVTLTAPGIMGWYGWLTFMECYHGVVSLDHGIEGTLAWQNQPLRFDGGRGYTEKDWGQSFPESWIWLQTNHFERPGISLTASVAHIPFIGTSFPGFIIGFWLDDQLYRFATYTGARIEHLELSEDHITWIVRDRKHELRMLIERASGTMLYAPSRIEMGERVSESMDGRVAVTLTERSSQHVVFEGLGQYAGLEACGDVDLLRPKGVMKPEP